MNNYNHLFKEKNIFSPDLYVQGLYIASKSEKDAFIKCDDAAECNKSSAVIPLQRGNVYVIRFENKPSALRAVPCKKNPAELAVGEGMSAPLNDSVHYFDGEPDDDCNFMYVPNTEGEFLLVYTGEEKPDFTVAQMPILLGYDTDDLWWYAPQQKDLFGNEDSWANWQWTSDEVYEKIYEPYRAKYPDYISRHWMGKDQTGKFDMWGYIYEPKDYEQVLFLTSGVHGEETDGYLGLARFLQYVADSDGSHEGLHYLRTKVKLVVVPIVNVGGASCDHLRENLAGVNLNRDFGSLEQAEALNTVHFFRQHGSQAAAAMDFHTSLSKALDLFYTFPIESEAAPCWLKTTNHIYEYLKKEGLSNEPTALTHVIGKYHKSDRFLQGYFYNHFGIPALICEHHHHRWYEQHSGESLQFAAHFYGNFIIQTALAKLKMIK